MKLLVVEDDEDFLAALTETLRPSYIVDIAVTGTDGYACAQTEEYDAIVLDLGLPGMSGLDICTSIRSEGITTPILILSGVQNLRDQVDLLDAGADDYVTKPFDASELQARLRVMLRRTAGYNTACLKVGPLILDTAQRVVTRAGQVITLRKKEFDLLEYLMTSRDRTVTRTMIADHVWDSDETPWTNAIDVHIKHLRDKIDRPYTDALIKTVHGIGYKLEAPKGPDMVNQDGQRGVQRSKRKEVKPHE